MAEVEYRPNFDSTKILKVLPAGMGGWVVGQLFCEPDNMLAGFEGPKRRSLSGPRS